MPHLSSDGASGRSTSNPYVFIVGCPRSGTTLLQRIVDAHPHITITPETHWIPRFFKERTGLTPDGFATPALIDALVEFRTFAKLHLDRHNLQGLLEDREPVGYARFVSGIFDLWGRRQGKPLVGDKTPGYARHLPLLHELWPNARFVHLIRDGRDVCLSTLAWKKAPKLASHFETWDEHPVTTAGQWWTWHVRSAREAGRALGPKLYCELRYEPLVAEPEAACAALSNFLGIPFDEAMLHFHEGRARTKPGLDAKHAWLPITPGLRDWRSQMSAADVACFEAAGGELLEELGYARAVPHPGVDALRSATIVRERFTKDSHAYSQRASLSDD